MNRSLPALVLLALLLMVGLAAGPPQSAPEGNHNELSLLAQQLPLRTQVYGPGAVPLAESAFPGELPWVEQRFVGVPALEPDLDFGDSGAALYYAFHAATEGPINYEVYNHALKTSDGGETWSDVTPLWLRDVDPAIDPVVYRDPLSGRIFLTGHNNYAPLHWTDNEGETWFTAPPIAGLYVTDYPRLWSVPAGDTATAGYPSVLFLCYNSGLAQECRRSVDGGLIWSLIPPPFLPTTPFHLPCAWTWSRVAGSAHDATLYMPIILQAGANTLEGHAACSDPTASPRSFEVWVSVSHDLGLSWEARSVAATFGDDVLRAADAQMRVAIDENGNAYLLFLGPDSLPRLSVSRDRGLSWSEPVVVAAPGVTAANLPSLAAGREGRIAFFYVGTTIPGGYAASEAEMGEATWHGYFTISLDALDEQPVFAATLTADPTDPLRRGPCEGRCFTDPTDCAINCDFGSPVSGMFDYTNIKVNPATGAAWVALVDLCDGACAEPGATSSAGWTNEGAVAVQAGGTFIKTPNATGDPTPIHHGEKASLELDVLDGLDRVVFTGEPPRP